MTDTILTQIQNTIDSRKGGNPEASYVAQLLHKGEDKILKKVIEEAGEVLMASKDGGGEHLVYEVADLWFHTMVLLARHGLRRNVFGGDFTENTVVHNGSEVV